MVINALYTIIIRYNITIILCAIGAFNFDEYPFGACPVFLFENYTLILMYILVIVRLIRFLLHGHLELVEEVLLVELVVISVFALFIFFVL